MWNSELLRLIAEGTKFRCNGGNVSVKLSLSSQEEFLVK
jgi:hypothetical protein